MGRATPWLVAAVCALVGGGVWAFRAGLPTKSADAESVVRDAWTEGRRVALRGDQVVRVSGAAEPVDARVLSPQQGSMRIEYRSEPLKGVTIWEDEGLNYRFNPKLERLTVARRRDSLHDAAAEKRLASYVGPLARLLIKDAASKTGNLKELYLSLADHIDSEEERREFLASLPR